MRGRRHGRSMLVAALLLVAPLGACATGGSEASEGGVRGGEVVGDPADIRTFTNPADQIRDASDLADYLLPGMSGAGVDCVVDGLDTRAILEPSREDGAWTAARVVTDCVSGNHFGRILAMYATDLDPSSEVAYADVERCVSREFLRDESANKQRLAAVLEARLDLEGPAASPTVARTEIDRSTGCFRERTGSTTTTRPRTTTTTTVAEPPTAPAPTLPPGAAQMSWTFVNAGSCVLDLPDGDTDGTTTIPCDSPHGGEVMSSGLGAPPEPDQCQTVASSYTGDRRIPWQASIVTVTQSESSGVGPRLKEQVSPTGATRTVCVIGPSDGTKVTGSVKG